MVNGEMPLRSALDGLRRLGRRARHNHMCRQILSTPPVVPHDDGVVVFSMVGTRVLLPYLVAIKSFMRALGRGRVIILDDGTLTAQDRAILAAHLGKPQFFFAPNIDTGDCPRGGCWERLVVLIELSADNYVIQLDSDTVTVGEVPEVREAVDAGRSFTLLGEPKGEATGLKTLEAFRASAYPAGPEALAHNAHVQHQIESRMDTLPGAQSQRYIRGCAGFAGFPRGSVTLEATESFSKAATAAVGAERWRQWGSEQVTSNYLVSNTADPLLLPYARYLNFWNQGVPDDAAFVHFIGTHRYARGTYASVTRRAITALR